MSSPGNLLLERGSETGSWREIDGMSRDMDSQEGLRCATRELG